MERDSIGKKLVLAPGFKDRKPPPTHHLHAIFGLFRQVSSLHLKKDHPQLSLTVF